DRVVEDLEVGAWLGGEGLEAVAAAEVVQLVVDHQPEAGGGLRRLALDRALPLVGQEEILLRLSAERLDAVVAAEVHLRVVDTLAGRVRADGDLPAGDRAAGGSALGEQGTRTGGAGGEQGGRGKQ